MSIKNLGLAVVSVAAPAILVAMLIGGAVAAWTFALVGLTLPAGLIALAAGESLRGVTGRVLLALLLLAEIAAGVMLALASDVGGPLWLGLPRATVIMGIALGGIPLVTVPLVYAAWFERRTGRSRPGSPTPKGPA